MIHTLECALCKALGRGLVHMQALEDLEGVWRCPSGHELMATDAEDSEEVQTSREQGADSRAPAHWIDSLAGYGPLPDVRQATSDGTACQPGGSGKKGGSKSGRRPRKQKQAPYQPWYRRG